MRKLLITLLLVLSHAPSARADLWGGDIPLLTQIVANTLNTLYELRKQSGMLDDELAGIKDRIQRIQTISDVVQPSSWEQWRDPREALRRLKIIYQTLPPEYRSAKADELELSGLRDQVRGLTVGYLGRILSPEGASEMRLEDAWSGAVLYFRLQSLLSQRLVATVGKLIINHLAFIAGTAHRQRTDCARFLPTYLDEFASFACPEFADLISKARSAGLALHFSHQSVGDLTEVSPGFLSRITDNSATKIVMRINDPDSAEQMSRTFGTSLYQKVTQRVTNAEEIDEAEIVGEGTQREAHQFRASPDLLKTLPTGMGSVLIAHGEETPHGASTVFRVRFPRLTSQKAPSGNTP